MNLVQVKKLNRKSPQNQYEFRSFETCLKLFPTLVDRCKKNRKDFASIINICRLCRSAWADYVHIYAAIGKNHYAPEIEKWLARSVEAVQIALDYGALDSGDTADAQHFLENLKMRARFAKVLNHQGYAAAVTAIENTLELQSIAAS